MAPVLDVPGNALGSMATRGQSDMRGFGYPHDRLVRRERRSSNVERGHEPRLLIGPSRMLLALSPGAFPAASGV